jgi:hypothetical protein
VKLAGEAYGESRSQSTLSAGPPAVKSLTIGRSGPASATACEATRVPST